MNLNQLKKRLWKSWTWKQRISYLLEKYNYFSAHAKEIRLTKNRLNKANKKQYGN